jgi:proteic killer suppression protein
VIKSFNSKALQRFAQRGDASKLSVQNVDRVTRILAALDAVKAPGAMDVPGWRFHPLTGDRKGAYSVTVSGNWRITFKMDGEDVIDVDLEDYH